MCSIFSAKDSRYTFIRYHVKYKCLNSKIFWMMEFIDRSTIAKRSREPEEESDSDEEDSVTCPSSEDEDALPPPEPFVPEKVLQIKMKNGKTAKVTIQMPPYEKGEQCRKCNHLSVDSRGRCGNCCGNPRCDQQLRKIGELWLCPEGHCDWCGNSSKKRTVDGLCKECDIFMRTECIGYEKP